MLVEDFGGLTPASLLIIIWILTAIAIVFVILRTAIRFYVHRSLSVDVFCVYVALAILISIAGIYTEITPVMFEIDRVSSGVERSTEAFMERATFFLRCQFALIVLFWTAVWAVKISILMFYKDLFHRLPRQKRYWWLVCAYVGLSYLACWGTQLASCWPIEDYFTLGKCNSPRDTKASNNSLYVTTALDIFGDLIMMALLLRQLYGLQTTQINRKQRIAVAGVFSLGGVIVVVAIVRVVEIKATTKHVDPVWLALWSMVEASVAVVVSCLPSFRILLSARSRSDSAYKRRNPSSSDPSGSSNPRMKPSLRRTSAIRLEIINARANLDAQLAARDSYDQMMSTESVGQTNTVITKSNREESQEDIVPPRNRVLVRQDMYTIEETV